MTTCVIRRSLWILAIVCTVISRANRYAAAAEGREIADGSYVVLEQGWDDDTREAFYFTSQGSQLIPYDWFLALEQADKAEPFRSNEKEVKDELWIVILHEFDR